MIPSYLKNETWRNRYPEQALKPLNIPHEPFYNILDRNANRGDWPALTFYGRTLSYNELIRLTNMMAKGLQELGVEKGDKVALMLPNIPQYLISFFGILKAGGVVVPLSPLYTPSELIYFIGDSEAKLIITLDIFKDKIMDVRKELHDLKAIYTNVGEYMSPLIRTLGRITGKLPLVRIVRDNMNLRFKDLLLSEDYTKVNIEPEDNLALLPYTGGTTGKPKGVMLTHYNVYANVLQTCRWLFPPLVEGETTVVVLPMFHSFGQVHVAAALYSGFRVILLPKFDIKEYMSTIEKYKPTLISGVPTIFSMIVNSNLHRRYDLSSVKISICAGDVLSPRVRDEFEEATGSVIIEGYGLTEASPVVCINPPYKSKRKVGTVGLPLPETLVAIMSLEVEGKLVDVGVPGEILVSGPQVMKGYHKPSAVDEEAFIEINGRTWLKTGDIGIIDEDGFLYMIDRKKDMIKYKGYSVFPKEIEETLHKHPAVKEVAVIGVPHEDYGEIPKAYVVLKDEYKGRVDEKELIDHCKKHLAPYKVPKIVEFRDTLPKSMIGKVLRRALREEFKHHKS